MCTMSMSMYACTLYILHVHVHGVYVPLILGMCAFYRLDAIQGFLDCATQSIECAEHIYIHCTLHVYTMYLLEVVNGQPDLALGVVYTTKIAPRNCKSWLGVDGLHIAALEVGREMGCHARTHAHTHTHTHTALTLAPSNCPRAFNRFPRSLRTP